MIEFINIGSAFFSGIRMLLGFGDFQRSMHWSLDMTDMVNRENLSVTCGRFYADGQS